MRVAETRAGEMVGYAYIYCRPNVAGISVLVRRDHRRHGLAQRLVDDVFKFLPRGMGVETWVAGFNRASLAAMAAVGRVLVRIIEDQGRRVYGFARTT